jgi:pyrimidine-nucleoside phosphorylase
MNFLSVLEAKRDGRALSGEEIRHVVTAFCQGKIPDYQMASFLMAVFFRGLTPIETLDLTLAMRDSGDVLRFPRDDRPLVDKHSTGGVGDKVSLPLAPLLACLGFRVPMISGRGLGITGGTLDKLDSIPGFKTTLPADRIIQIVQETGCIICGQTDKMVPADRGLYSLRDVTGTVPSIPLIVASILSKKLAEGLDALILDVKFGRAAFMSDINAARELAQAMVTLGNECGVKTRAILSCMDSPLGSTAGNWLEVKEAVACLEGKGPADLELLVVSSAGHLLHQTGKASEAATGMLSARECLKSGAPRKKWDEMISAQGADLDKFYKKLEAPTSAVARVEIPASRSGFVQRCDARIIGEIVRDLGGGRLTKETQINHEVGVEILCKTGDAVNEGEPLARIYAQNTQHAETYAPRVIGAFEIGDKPLPLHPLIAEVVDTSPCPRSAA